MRFPLPPKHLRAAINAQLRDFYAEGDPEDFTAALHAFCAFYEIRPPRIRWRHTIHRGYTQGLTHPSDNLVELVKPSWWRRRKGKFPEYTEDDWLRVVWHEWWHILTSVDEERRADQFAAAALDE